MTALDALTDDAVDVVLDHALICVGSMGAAARRSPERQLQYAHMTNGISYLLGSLTVDGDAVIGDVVLKGAAMLRVHLATRRPS